MPAQPSAAVMLEGETRALLTRLARVRPFALHETMVPAAAPAPAAQIAIERLLIEGRRELRGRLHRYIDWLRVQGATTPPAEMQRRFAILRWRFNDVLTQFDLFQEVFTQRSEQDVGVWLSGLDVAAADALAMPGVPGRQPSAVCYLDRGPGAAIRKARARLPGGGRSPVAIIRVPRERMIGYGIGASLVHEAGHQAAALLDLVEPLRQRLRVMELRSRCAREALAWRLWQRWISEIVADFWAVGKLGIAATLGLISVVSLPRWFVFRVSVDDPHPFPYIRVRLSCAIGQALYPHAQWNALGELWSSLYPAARLDDERRQLISGLEATFPQLADVICKHRPSALQGRALVDLLPLADRTPRSLEAHYGAWAHRPVLMRSAPPTLVFAVLGHARSAGRLTPESESRLLGELIKHWALSSTLGAAAACAAPPVPAASPSLNPIPIRR
ncbi:hypothetical protein E1264_29085 [Actinomadura sp. KC216]|uniref:hypothetical protein n=1 Tax=Actinomadura sp. KC216 TaxID=2530370 RepID=UPI0010453C85|nr:hypothetical protein [Actinomadura sp. KC216]TDB83268.1 hypothetical protein E1264_29085 [Actinomadura sp. KC216]